MGRVVARQGDVSVAWAGARSYDRLMKAAILALGSELLGTDRLDTNSLRLTASLERHGVDLVRKAVVGDSEAAISAEIRGLLDGRSTGDAEGVGLIVVTGGLGPTADDVTRPAVAHALDRGLRRDEEIVEALRRRFARYGRVMAESNLQQAEVIDGAVVLDNSRGSAPGQRVDAEGVSVFLFPGVPVEVEGMIEKYLDPWLAARGDGRGIARRTLKVAALPESEVESRIAPAYEDFGRENISVLASPGEVKLVAVAHGSPDERIARLDTMTDRLAELAGDAVYTRGDGGPDEGENLETVLGRLLTEAGATLCTAESCTGGLVAQRLTSVAGSSAFFLGGVVSYSNALKHRLLGVPEAMLEAHGAVSEPVARAMARGVRDRYASGRGIDYGIGITGVAGPGGGSAEKPVGTVHLTVSGPIEGPGASPEADADGVIHRRVRLLGDRGRIRWLSSVVVLEMLRRRLLGLPQQEAVSTGKVSAVSEDEGA